MSDNNDYEFSDIDRKTNKPVKLRLKLVDGTHYEIAKNGNIKEDKK